MKKLLKEIETRWQQMFTALAAGDDLPPGQRLRTEGLMEAAVLLGASEETLQQQMEACYSEAFGHPISDALGEDWQGFHRFPEIPAFARRAPVVPTTAE